MLYDTIIIGAGPAGFFAAIAAGERGRRVLLLEKGNKTGVKILMSGGTRCNLTQNTDARGIVAAFGPNGKFLHSALALLSPDDIVQWFNENGVATKVEPTGKIFPVSDRAIDVRNALLECTSENERIDIRTNQQVEKISGNKGAFQVTTNQSSFNSKTVIIATGGCSYPGCGTTGDGYQWAEDLGHTIVPPIPALTPVVSSDQWVKDLKGVTLPDVLVGVFEKENVVRISEKNFEKLSLACARGSLLFAHFGLSGPTAMNVSKQISSRPDKCLKLVVDLVPQVSRSEIVEIFRHPDLQKKSPKAVLQKWLPAKLAQSFVDQLGVQPHQNLAETKNGVIRQLEGCLKHCEINLEGTRGFKKAEVTSGGISLNEVNSHTMESKLCDGLYLVGEVLDLDGPIGGFNFQSAFSTGYLAGKNV